MSKIYEYKGIKYKIVLGNDNHPCDHCELQKECDSDDFDDLMMLCGCDFCDKPYYCIRI